MKNNLNNIPDGRPQYEDDRQIEIGSFAGPRKEGYRFWNGEYKKHPEDPKEGWKSYVTEKDLQDYMEAGFTFALSEGDAWYDYNAKEGRKVEDYREADIYPYMELAEKVGLSVVPSAQWLVKMSDGNADELTDEQKAKLKQLVDDLSQYKCFKGLMLRDEPFLPSLKSFGNIHRYLESIKPDIFMYTCMLPIYGRVNMFTNDLSESKEQAYTGYVQEVARQTGSFIYDHYPLYIDYRDPDNVTTLFEPDYYMNLEIVAKQAKEMKFDAGLVVQSSSWGPYGKEYEICHPRRTDTKADISFQVYSAIAYGMKNLGYYTYWEHYIQSESSAVYSAMLVYPKKEDGTPDVDGEPVKTPAYYAVKEVNEEIKKFDHVFLHFNWEGTMAVIPDGREASELLSYVKEYQSPRIRKATASEETIIGCQKDENGYDGFVVVNVTDPGNSTEDFVRIEFECATSALCYINGEEQLIPLSDGVFEYNLEAGQGIFIIPVK